MAGVGSGHGLLVAVGRTPERGVPEADLLTTVLRIHPANKIIMTIPDPLYTI